MAAVSVKRSIRHFHIFHNAPYLPPKFCITFVFLLGITAVPREIENNAYAKFLGANKVRYGKCGSGVLDDQASYQDLSFRGETLKRRVRRRKLVIK